MSAPEYKIVSAKNSTDLTTKVTTAIADGYEPQGGVMVDTRTLDPTFYQAMYNKGA